MGAADELGQLRPFEEGKRRLLFLSRGRGRDHAVPDMAMAAELARRNPNLDLRFVSYSTNAAAFRSCGWEVIDLGMPDDPPILDLIVAETRVIGYLNPHLIVAHEEFFAPVAARVFGTPVIFVTDFFQDPNSLVMIALKNVAEIIFAGEPGVYTEPPYLRGKVRYVGPVVRRFEYSRSGRARARSELGLPAKTSVVLCLPGSWTESIVGILDLIAGAWDLLPFPAKHLMWLAGRDFELVRSRFGQRTDVTVLKEDWRIDRLMVASNVLITKGSRASAFEAASYGLPAISLSSGANWADDVALLRIPSNLVLNLPDVTPALLRDAIAERIAQGWVEESALPRWDGMSRAAELIANHIDALLQDAPGRS